ncbi:MAG: hypothetical protein JF625_03215 [Inquilinus limosus]|uniref:Uncharacterized protein n=1 Tax=Inquilinus limosus TaxID=171674 RepID=A0A952FJ82_9PROT|nr:hypothetical protein [Inquilinus limosus]
MTPLRLTRRHALEVGTGVAGPAGAGLARPARAAETQLRMAFRAPDGIASSFIPFMTSKIAPLPPKGSGEAAAATGCG